MTHDPYWNHSLSAADLAAAPAPREAEVATPLPPDPDPSSASLDGVSLEQLGAARIAKHKELLTPPADPVVPELAAMRASVDNTRLTLAAILAVLRQIRDRLPGGGHH